MPLQGHTADFFGQRVEDGIRTKDDSAEEDSSWQQSLPGPVVSPSSRMGPGCPDEFSGFSAAPQGVKVDVRAEVRLPGRVQRVHKGVLLDAPAQAPHAVHEAAAQQSSFQLHPHGVNQDEAQSGCARTCRAAHTGFSWHTSCSRRPHSWRMQQAATFLAYAFVSQQMMTVAHRRLSVAGASLP